MNRDENRVLIRKMLRDRRLPGERLGIAGTGKILMTGGTAPPEPCAVCGLGPTHLRCGDPSEPGLAFDQELTQYGKRK
jgi:hypothetical protein